MPFTVSHAAAVLPFSRYLNRAHVLSAAVIGSMVPDFGIFLPLTLERSQTHGLHPLVTFCLPLGLATYWLFQCLIKVPLLELLPDATYLRWQGHAAPASITRFSQWLLAAIGITFGTLSHLALDAFTHEGARGVRWFPFLDEPNVDVAGQNFYGFAALQLISSVIGLLIVIGCVRYVFRSPSSPQTPLARPLTQKQRHHWVYGSLAAAVLLTIALFAIDRQGLPAMGHTAYLAGDAAVAALRATAIVMVAGAGLLQFRLRRALCTAGGAG